MVPLVGHANELRLVRELLERVAQEVQQEKGVQVPCKIGTMIELPRAALTADEIARHADFFSFGTNDLTQTTYGMSRDDAEGKFLLKYVERGILPENPFQTLDREGVGALIKMGVERGRSTYGELELGICGEHGGDPSCIQFCHEAGLDYVSASPFRVPVARLAAAQRALAEALDRNADIKELERLMNEVQKALQKFMSSLMRELRQRGQLPPTDPNAEVTNMQDLQRLLDRMRELMRQGSREAAKQLMAELQRMLQSLRGALARRGQQSEEARRAQQTMRELRAIIRRQQKLLDETFRRTRPGNRGRPGEERSEANTDGLDEQQAVRRELGKMMRKFGEQAGEIPKGLGDAERSMRRSERAFGQGRPGDSIDPQNQALDALRRGAQNSARALARRLGRGGIGRGRFDPRGGRFGAFTGPRLRGLRPGNRDPFGRQLEEGSSGTATGRVKIPEESEIQRARKILNELRKRLGDQWRPEVELDYIERLLKRF